MAAQSKDINLPLTPQQWMFVEEYCADPSSHGKAALRAGYAKGSATHTAQNLLANPRIQAAIQKVQARMADDIGITKARVLQELALIAFAKITPELTGDLQDVTLQQLSAQSKDFPVEVIISSTKGKDSQKTVTIKTVKPADKLAALEKLGKHLGMFKEVVEIKNLTLDKLIEASFTTEEDTSAS